jgi:hypothetical protein
MFMATESNNYQRLLDAGVIIGDERLPPAYAAVVEGLTPDEVDVIVAVTQRLKEADRVEETSDFDEHHPGFTTFMSF